MMKRSGRMKLMICYEASGHNERFLERAAEFARSFQGRVRFVSCMFRDSHLQDRNRERDEKYLDRAKAWFAERGIAADSHILLTAATEGEALMEYARQEEFNMLMVGIRRRSKLGKFVYGSTAQYLILESHCPVVCIP